MAGSSEKQRANLVPFTPGVSGNPSGISKERAEVKRRFEENATQYFERLEAFAGDTKNPWLAFEATKLQIAYAIGKPMAVLAGPDGGPLELSVHAEALLMLVKRLVTG